METNAARSAMKTTIPREAMASVTRRLDVHSQPEPNTGCFLWTAFRNSDGYGKLRLGKRCWIASRLAYIVHVGPIPSGSLVLHRCDTPACVNPEHLFLGTDRDNADDKVRKGRSAAGENAGLARLTNEQVEHLRALGMRRALELAPSLGVPSYVISRAVSGRTWKYAKGATSPGRAAVDAEKVLAIRTEWDGSHGALARLSRKHGVSMSHVHRIVHGKARAEVRP